MSQSFSKAECRRFSRGLLGMWWLVGGMGCASQSAPNPEQLAASDQAVSALENVVARLPGEEPLGVAPTSVQFGSIVPVVTETGFLRMSIDGLGTLDATGAVQVEKPAGATVRRAFVAAASTGASGRQLVDGDVTVDGAAVSWLISTQSSIGSWNHWAEVTALVAPKIDAAPAGRVDFEIGERGSAGIEGEILAVIFDDPQLQEVSTVAFLFGAQQVEGDTFHVRLSDPLDLAKPDLRLDLSLGISFGYIEGENRDQFSLIDVNGQRLTSSAGGEDDGVPANGALLTVGGLDDSNDNPPPNDPTPATADNTRFDDELYDLRPFVHTGDTELDIFTQNPSNNDNIFFSALLVSGAAVIGEGVVLGPGSARDPVGASHALTATVQNALGRPVADRAVTLTVLSGPNGGETEVATTDASGKAEFSYVGDGGTGVDELQASFLDSRSTTQVSNVALEEWFVVERAPIVQCHNVSRAVGDSCSIDVLPAEVGSGTIDPDGDPLSFTLAPSGPFALGSTPVTLTVTDNSGLSASCTATVTALDTTAPTLTVPDSVVTGCAASNSAGMTFATSTSDNCGAATLSCVDGAGQTVASGATFPIGSTTVTCQATDSSGNRTTKSFSVDVTGNAAPPVIHPGHQLRHPRDRADRESHRRGR